MADKTYTEAEVKQRVQDALLVKHLHIRELETMLGRVLRRWVTDTKGLDPKHEGVFKEACAMAANEMSFRAAKLSNTELKQWLGELKAGVADESHDKMLLVDITCEIDDREREGLL